MKKLSESVWGDIRKKSLGQEVREEDNVDLLDKSGFLEYLKSHYKHLNGKQTENFGASMMIPVFSLSFVGFFHLTAIWHKTERLDTIWFYYLEKANLVKMESIIEPLKKFCKMINFTKQPCKFEFKPKDGSPVSNTFLLRIIDTIIENAQFPCLSKAVEESVWGDIRKKSLGQEARMEESGNVKDLKPVDLGLSVLWADKDFELNGETEFYIDDIKDIAPAGWRRPTREEADELLTDAEWNRDEVLSFNKPFKSIITISHNGKSISFSRKNLAEKWEYWELEKGDMEQYWNMFRFESDGTFFPHSSYAIGRLKEKHRVRFVREK